MSKYVFASKVKHILYVFSHRDDDSLHKAVDVVCDDYSIVNAPFSGTLRGPVVGIQYDGVKLTNSGEHFILYSIHL